MGVQNTKKITRPKNVGYDWGDWAGEMTMYWLFYPDKLAVLSLSLDRCRDI